MAERANPFVFLQQVRSEVSKVVWPSRRETAITTAMVFAFVILASVFFFVADMIMAWGVARILGIGA